MLTRAWVFVNSDGASTEVKGPGVVGAMPILGPGQVYEYSSGTRINTGAGGSFYGSFQFEVLSATEDLATGEAFSVPVDRLALSPSGQELLVHGGPCNCTRKHSNFSDDIEFQRYY